MDLNGLRTVLSALSLIALVLALVLWFSNSHTGAYILIAVGVVMKIAEIITRLVLKHQKNKEEYGYYDK